jgi:glutathione S-transferase
MKVYFDPISTSSRPVTFLLHDQDIPFEEAPVSLHLGEHMAPAFARLNPMAQLPLLDDEGFLLPESSAILKYIAQKHELALYPTDLRAQARVDEMLGWFSTNFRAYHCILGVYPQMLPALAHLAPATRADMAALSAYGSKRHLTVLDEKLGRHAYAAGDQLSIADYYGISQVTLAEYTAFDFSPYPNVMTWIERMKARRGYHAAFAGFHGLVRASRGDSRQSA